MPLQKIKDFDPDYRSHFEDQDIISYDLYTGEDKVGSVDDLLVDETGKIRYLIINTGAWIFGKKVLLPIGRARIDYSNHRVAVDGFTREQVEALPKYDGNMPVDYEHEEQVRSVYRPMAMGTAPADSPAMTMDAPAVGSADPASAPTYNRDTYAYDRDPGLYNLDERNHQNLRLYEERLIANKTRSKTGEVSVGKRVETETIKAAIPLEKERVIIEHNAPSNASGAAVTPDETAFKEGEVARMEIYEETPDVRKEAFVREEVSIRKEVDTQTFNAEEMLRREELDVDKQGRTVMDKGSEQNRKNEPMK
jgi:uncharacterized protein (TIGR02271 family)